MGRPAACTGVSRVCFCHMSTLPHPLVCCSGLSLLFEQPKRASELMLFCLPRAVEVMFALLERRGLARRFRYGEAFVFCAALAIMLSLDRRDFSKTYASVLRFLFGPERAPPPLEPQQPHEPVEAAVEQ